jgi:polyisoprenoid-binding protein YceI
MPQRDLVAPASSTQASEPAPATPSQTARTYQIDPEASTLHILVYRGGTLARLGHNHVISSRSINGSLWQGKTPEDSGFTITVPVTTLIVDDNDARAAEGEDFPLNITEEARQGTKTNMLRETLLDSVRYPHISIQSVRLQDHSGAPLVVASLRIKDQTRQITLPVTLQSANDKLQVKGEFEIKQTDFGITPLNVAMGALLVLDTIKIKFELVAKAGPKL